MTKNLNKNQNSTCIADGSNHTLCLLLHSLPCSSHTMNFHHPAINVWTQSTKCSFILRFFSLLLAFWWEGIPGGIHTYWHYSIHTWQRLMFFVDEAGLGFFTRLFFLTMSYRMKICFLLLLAPTILAQVLYLWKFQLFWWSFTTEVIPEVSTGTFSMRRKNLSSADALKDLCMLHRLAKTVMRILPSSSSQKFKLLNSVFIQETAFSSCLSWTVYYSASVPSNSFDQLITIPIQNTWKFDPTEYVSGNGLWRTMLKRAFTMNEVCKSFVLCLFFFKTPQKQHELNPTLYTAIRCCYAELYFPILLTVRSTCPKSFVPTLVDQSNHSSDHTRHLKKKVNILSLPKIMLTSSNREMSHQKRPIFVYSKCWRIYLNAHSHNW